LQQKIEAAVAGEIFEEFYDILLQGNEMMDFITSPTRKPVKGLGRGGKGKQPSCEAGPQHPFIN